MKHESACQCDNCREIREKEWAEKQKKAELYDPDTCPDQGEPGCSYPDCDNCGIYEDYEDGAW